MTLDHIHACRNEDRRRRVPGVSATLTGLSADEVDTCIKCLDDMVWVSDHLEQQMSLLESPSDVRETHVHDGYARLVQFLNCMWRWNTDSTDEEGGFLLDNNVKEFVELSLLIVILVTHVNYSTPYRETHDIRSSCVHYLRPVE